MKKFIIRIIIRVSTIIIGGFAFILYSFYLMDIEDRYGDLQQLYFDSKSGDIIINNMNGNIGLIEFNKRRVFVNTGKKTLHIDEWLDPQNKYIINTDIYRPKFGREYLNLKRNEIEKKLKSENLESISHLEIKY
ncbi:hypothetical protein RF683_06845 [Flavobacterium sp. 20NA77.7]|uniref:Uncharacterized protein n=1 Tax=Flavobacterium nakdongensis TaxID=3073563 RepID=A0ABY9R7G6_9FLAO|nr:hypothetical protein [Flavobacterium sp. 20NA77.7]WMW77212.1 hypothetical protein RF683_06845 [Flavobacterium sp. 20NA77.7]